MKATFINSITAITLAASVSGIVLVGCKDTDYPTPTPSTSGFLTTAKVLIANASDASGLTALLENAAVGSTLAPGANTGYTPAPVSSDQIRVQGAGGTLGATDLTTKSTFAANTNYTVFVTDTTTRPKIVNALSGATTDVGGLRFLTVTDNLSTTLTSGANVRAINLSPDAAVSGTASVTAVSFRLSVPSSSTALPAAVGSFTNRAYRAATAAITTFSNVPANTYRVDVFAGSSLPTAATSATLTPIASTTVVLADTKFYTLYTRGVGKKKTLAVSQIQHN